MCLIYSGPIRWDLFLGSRDMAEEVFTQEPVSYTLDI